MSTEFLPQLFERLFKEKTPTFYAIIRKNSLWFTVLVVAFPFVVTDILPNMFGVQAPQWLTYLNTKAVIVFSALAGMGLGSAGVASTTITKASPPLASDSPTAEELAIQMADLQTKYELLIKKKATE